MASIPDDYHEKIKKLRKKFDMTQIKFAHLLGVSFATVNRWENRQVKPSPLAWARIVKFDD